MWKQAHWNMSRTWPALLAAVLVAGPLQAAHACDDNRSTAAGFMPAKLCPLLDAPANHAANIHAIVVLRHGAIVAERYYTGTDRSIWSPWSRTVRFDAATPHDLRSITKSITSLLWGIAQGQGRTPPLETPVLDLYPELVGLKTGGRQAVTLRHLFTMSSGLAWQEPVRYDASNDETGLFWRSSQVRYVFDRPVKNSGAGFHYNGGGTAVLADVLAQRVGMPLPDYARTHLFAPLGISDWEWKEDLRGRPMAYAGLRMRPADLAKIGQLVLQRGAWQGRQLVPAAWIAESLRPQVQTGDGLQYGYQWWSGTVEAVGGKHQWHAGFGNGGQRVFIVPGLELVVVVTAGGYDDMGSGRRAMGVFRAVAGAIVR